jgi:Zn-dependent M16 (insulinase) family peptidase
MYLSVREYHREYYVPQNLCLIVAGKLSTKDLLDTLATHVEPSIVKHCQAKGFHPDGWTRPFMETASAEKIVLHGAVEETIEFPDKDDKTPGEIVMTFIGPAPAEYLERLV